MSMSHVTRVIKELTGISTSFIAHYMLPEKFTLTQLRQLHELILNRKLDRSRFQQKIVSLDIYERLAQIDQNTRGRKPYLYTSKFKNQP